jgi:hypothetical protein
MQLRRSLPGPAQRPFDRRHGPQQRREQAHIVRVGARD